MGISKYILTFAAIIFLGLLFYKIVENNLSYERSETVGEIRDYMRLTDVNVIASSIELYFQDFGRLPVDIPSIQTGICLSNLNDECVNLLNLASLNGKYLVEIPRDPLIETGEHSGYDLRMDGELIIVSAPLAELEVIEAIRGLSTIDE